MDFMVYYEVAWMIGMFPHYSRYCILASLPIAVVPLVRISITFNQVVVLILSSTIDLCYFFNIKHIVVANFLKAVHYLTAWWYFSRFYLDRAFLLLSFSFDNYDNIAVINCHYCLFKWGLPRVKHNMQCAYF